MAQGRDIALSRLEDVYNWRSTSAKPEAECIGLQKIPLLQRSKPVEFWAQPERYDRRVLVGNWYENRRNFDVPCCSDNAGKTSYCCEYPTYQSCDYDLGDCIAGRRFDRDGEGWALLRNTEQYRKYWCNFTTTYDLLHNWKVREACSCPPCFRKWSLIRGQWLPLQDSTCPVGNLTCTGATCKKGWPNPDCPKDPDLYCMRTEYSSKYVPACPQDYTNRRFAPPRCVKQELEPYARVRIDKPVPRNCCGACKASCSCNCCPCKCQSKLPKRFDGKRCLTEIKEHPGCQTLYASRIEPYQTLENSVC